MIRIIFLAIIIAFLLLSFEISIKIFYSNNLKIYIQILFVDFEIKDWILAYLKEKIMKEKPKKEKILSDLVMLKRIVKTIKLQEIKVYLTQTYERNYYFEFFSFFSILDFLSRKYLLEVKNFNYGIRNGRSFDFDFSCIFSLSLARIMNVVIKSILEKGSGLYGTIYRWFTKGFS